MTIYFSSQKGRRPSNEDGHTIKVFLNPANNQGKYADVNIYAIYDGHGGTFVSKYLQENLYKYFINKKLQYPLDKKYILNAYKKVQDELTNTNGNRARQCGSTCICVLHFKDTVGRTIIQVLNTGDSRSCLCRGSKAIRLTEDHKPNTLRERARITSLGGKIIYDGMDYRIGNLSVSRAFGDNDTKPFVVETPDMFKYVLQNKDRFLVIACDGLWDVMTDQAVINFILKNCFDKNTNRINKHINIARQLIDYAINDLKSTDNVSVIIVFFD
jgi:serine/threonine protein phosphatase PrpC